MKYLGYFIVIFIYGRLTYRDGTSVKTSVLANGLYVKRGIYHVCGQSFTVPILTPLHHCAI